MGSPERDPHLRPDHPYPTMPAGVRICDDDVAAGDFFFYRDRELIVHSGDGSRTRTSLLTLGYREREHYDSTRSPTDSSLTLFRFTADSPVDTIDVYRRLRNVDVEDAGPTPDDDADEGRSTTGPLRVWPNHVVGVQSHTKWGAGAPPRPREPLSALPVGSNLPGSGVARRRAGHRDRGPAVARRPLGARRRPLPRRCRRAAGRPVHVALPGRARLVRDRHDSPARTGRRDRRRPPRRLDGLHRRRQLHTRLSALLDGTNRLDVLNLSLGGYTADNRPMPGVCTVLDSALDANPDLVVVASAGNDGVGRFLWPAALSRVVGVGHRRATAVAAAGGPQRWPESNFGEWVNAWSLGEDLSSTFLHFPAGPEPPLG